MMIMQLIDCMHYNIHDFILSHHTALTKPTKMDLKTVEGVGREGVLMGKLMLWQVHIKSLLHFVMTIPDKLIMHLLLG